MFLQHIWDAGWCTIWMDEWMDGLGRPSKKVYNIPKGGGWSVD